jgi:hypothetical protein
MKKKNLLYGICFSMAVAAGIYGCGSNSDYSKIAKEELAKGKHYDSLFLGIKFGMTSKEFYGYCWELNKKGIISDGANNTMVLYKMDTALRYPALMNFYPDFYADKVFHMRVTFQYTAWAPWNKPLFSDSLLPDVVRLLTKWYGGNAFLPLTDKAKGTIYVKVDGNRRITVGRYDDMIVKADYTDLLVETKPNK